MLEVPRNGQHRALGLAPVNRAANMREMGILGSNIADLARPFINSNGLLAALERLLQGGRGHWAVHYRW